MDAAVAVPLASAGLLVLAADVVATAPQDVRFVVKIRTTLRNQLSTSSDLVLGSGTSALTFEQRDQPWEGAIAIDAPELSFRNDQSRTDPSFYLMAWPPSLHVSAHDANDGECRFDRVSARSVFHSSMGTRKRCKVKVSSMPSS